MMNLVEWHYTAEYPIEKIVPDTEHNIMVVEKRNSGQGQVCFDVLDLKNKKKLIENLTLWENWWVSVAEVVQKMIFFTLYEPENSWTSKGIIVYDIEKESIVWQNTQLCFYKADQHNTCIWARENIQTSVYKAYHWQNGTALKDIPFIGTKPSVLQYPIHYPPESPYYEDLSRFIQKKTQHSVSGEINYLEQEEHICIVYRIEIQEKFAYFLLITDIAGNIQILREVATVPTQLYMAWHHFWVITSDTKTIHIYFLA
jgi:hypothetical protein